MYASFRHDPEFALQTGAPSASGGRPGSPQLHPASPPEFKPSPIDLAHFAEGENHSQRLVDLFLHTAYPRAPTAVPPNEPWKVSVHTADNMVGYPLSPKGDKHHPLSSNTRYILAYGPGVWQPRILARTFGEDSNGDRLALLLPDAAKSGVHVPGNSKLPPTTWEYRQILKDVTPPLEPRNHFLAPITYASFWICRPVDKAGHRLKDSRGRDVGIVVVFARESEVERKDNRQYDHHGLGKLSARWRYEPPGASPALVALARAVMVQMDADGVPPAVGWSLHYKDQDRTQLHIQGASAHVWVRCKAQLQETVMYTLPEGREAERRKPERREHREGREAEGWEHFPQSVMFSWKAHQLALDGSPDTVRRHCLLSVEFLGKTVHEITNLVLETRWKVSPKGPWPHELGNLQEIVFEA